MHESLDKGFERGGDKQSAEQWKEIEKIAQVQIDEERRKQRGKP